MADRNQGPRDQIKGYSLWLQKISGSNRKAPHSAGIRVAGFAVKGPHDSVAASGSGGAGKAVFDTLDLSVVSQWGSEFAQLARAQESGANTGKGRLDAVLASGCSRHLLSFEDSMVHSISTASGGFGEEPQFSMQLSIQELKILWEPLRR